MKLYSLCLILGIGLFLPVAAGRTWTSADGTKTFVAELKSYDEGKGIVIIRKINGENTQVQAIDLIGRGYRVSQDRGEKTGEEKWRQFKNSDQGAARYATRPGR